MSNIGVPEILIICIVVLVFALVVLIPYWRIFGKAGLSPLLILLMLLPIVNIVMLYVLAFSDWPSLKVPKETN